MAGPVIVSRAAAQAEAALDAVRDIPALVWGRDEIRCGEMWNSNSVIAFALARANIDADQLRPPAHGRAPGWLAGLALAHRR